MNVTSIFQVKLCGIDFRWNMFGMTIRDADNLAMGLRICRKLRKIKIYNSKIDDDKFYAVYDGIKSLTHLGKLIYSFLCFLKRQQSISNVGIGTARGCTISFLCSPISILA